MRKIAFYLGDSSNPIYSIIWLKQFDSKKDFRIEMKTEYDPKTHNEYMCHIFAHSDFPYIPDSKILENPFMLTRASYRHKATFSSYAVQRFVESDTDRVTPVVMLGNTCYSYLSQMYHMQLDVDYDGNNSMINVVGLSPIAVTTSLRSNIISIDPIHLQEAFLSKPALLMGAILKDGVTVEEFKKHFYVPNFSRNVTDFIGEPTHIKDGNVYLFLNQPEQIHQKLSSEEYQISGYTRGDLVTNRLMDEILHWEDNEHVSDTEDGLTVR